MVEPLMRRVSPVLALIWKKYQIVKLNDIHVSSLCDSDREKYRREVFD